MSKLQLILIVLILSINTNVLAVDKIPREDFIKFTDSCINTLDEVEVAFSKYTVYTHEAEKQKDNFELCIKKYYRYGDFREWDQNSSQYFVVNKFSVVRVMFPLVEAGLRTLPDFRKFLRKTNDEVSSELIKYKAERPKKTSKTK